MKVILTNKITNEINVFTDEYIWVIVKSNLQYDNELDDYIIEYEKEEK